MLGKYLGKTGGFLREAGFFLKLTGFIILVLIIGGLARLLKQDVRLEDSYD